MTEICKCGHKFFTKSGLVAHRVFGNCKAKKKEEY